MYRLEGSFALPAIRFGGNSPQVCNCFLFFLLSSKNHLVDGVLVPLSAIDAIKLGKINSVPVMAGSTFDEFFDDNNGNPLSSADYTAALKSTYGAAALDELLLLYPNSLTDLRQQFTTTKRDFNVFCPNFFQARQLKTPTFLYLFEHRFSFSDLPPGIDHGMDIWALFQQPYNFGFGGKISFQPEEIILSNNFVLCAPARSQLQSRPARVAAGTRRILGLQHDTNSGDQRLARCSLRLLEQLHALATGLLCMKRQGRRNTKHVNKYYNALFCYYYKSVFQNANSLNCRSSSANSET